MPPTETERELTTAVVQSSSAKPPKRFVENCSGGWREGVGGVHWG